jgi:hypothetical protein
MFVNLFAFDMDTLTIINDFEHYKNMISMLTVTIKLHLC